jgi:hypothetical protein
MSSIDPNSGLVGFDNIAFFTQKKCNPRYLSYYFKDKTRCKLCSLARNYTVKRLAIFPSPAGMSLTKLSLGENN